MNIEPSPAVPHYDGAVVQLALSTLACFGGLDSLDRDSAATLLSIWRFRALLSEHERAAVLKAFPLPAIPAIPAQVDGKAIGTRH